MSLPSACACKLISGAAETDDAADTRELGAGCTYSCKGERWTFLPNYWNMAAGEL